MSSASSLYKSIIVLCRSNWFLFRILLATFSVTHTVVKGLRHAWLLASDWMAAKWKKRTVTITPSPQQAEAVRAASAPAGEWHRGQRWEDEARKKQYLPHWMWPYSLQFFCRQCSASCEGGTTERRAECLSADGQVSVNCDAGLRPADEISQCNTHPCCTDLLPQSTCDSFTPHCHIEIYTFYCCNTCRSWLLSSA